MAVETSDPRTRRSFLVAAAGGLVGFTAAVLGRPLPVAAANGSPVLLGRSGSATTTTTVGTTSGTGLQGKSSSSSGRGVIGSATRTSGSTLGVYGLTASASGDGVRGTQNAGAAGSGAAVRAIGNKNDGVVATTAGATGRAAVRATSTGDGLAVRAMAPGRVAEIRRTGGPGPVLVVTDSSTGSLADPDVGDEGAVWIGTDGMRALAIRSANTEGLGNEAIYAVADGPNANAIWAKQTTAWDGDPATADEFSGGSAITADSGAADGIGVWASGTVGVWGQSNNNGPGDCVGVKGEAPIGVRGISQPHAKTPSYGVHGVAHDATAHAGYFEGQLATTHSLLFHDLDPAAPTAPPSHQVRLFARRTADPDKLELCAQFDSGQVVVLATQA